MRGIRPGAAPRHDGCDAAPAATKLHWRDAGQGERLDLTARIGSLDVEHLIVVRLGGTEAKSERRRRQCMRRLFFELSGLGVSRVVAESRGRADDCRDRNLLERLRSTGEIASSLRLFHEPGPAEPLLWIPDVVAGALTAHRVAGADLGMLERRVQIVEIDDR